MHINLSLEGNKLDNFMEAFPLPSPPPPPPPPLLNLKNNHQHGGFLVKPYHLVFASNNLNLQMFTSTPCFTI